MSEWQSEVLVPAVRAGLLVELRAKTMLCTTPLSLWGGLDPKTGEVIDRRHPQSGLNLSGQVVFLPFGRGSSSASSILLESVKLGTAPAAFVLTDADGILALGAAVARELYQASPAILVLGEEAWQAASQSHEVEIDRSGLIRALG